MLPAISFLSGYRGSVGGYHVYDAFLIGSSDGVCALVQKIVPKSGRKALGAIKKKKRLLPQKKKSPDWKLFLKGYCTTFLIYGVLLLGISEIGRLLLWPALEDALSNSTIAAILTCIAIYMVMAPFYRR